MYINNSHITIFCGHLGSGKTEIAINYSFFLYEKGKKVNLVDLDIVNPYFRTRIVKEELGQQGIDVICPPGELAGADVPALSPEILRSLTNPGINGVFDVGGDDIGAVVLGRFRPYLSEDSYDLFFVVNSYRPFSRTEEKIAEYLESIEHSSRLKVTGLVNNSNLGSQTTLEDVLAGHELTEKAAGKLNIPVAFTAAKKTLAPALREKLDNPVLPLDLFMKPPWNSR